MLDLSSFSGLKPIAPPPSGLDRTAKILQVRGMANQQQAQQVQQQKAAALQDVLANAQWDHETGTLDAGTLQKIDQIDPEAGASLRSHYQQIATGKATVANMGADNERQAAAAKEAARHNAEMEVPDATRQYRAWLSDNKLEPSAANELKFKTQGKVDSKIDEFTDDKGQRVLTMQRPDGTTYQQVSGKQGAPPQATRNPPSSVGEYNFYSQQETAAGRKPLSYDAWQTRDANRKTPATSVVPVDIAKGTKNYRVAQDLAYGKLTFADFKSLYGRAAATAELKTSLYDKARELNPEFNPAAFEMGFKLASNPKVQQQLASMDNVKEGVPDLLKFSDLAARSGFPTLNKYVINPGGIALGNKKYSNLAEARVGFADELSGALGFGGATDMSKQMGFDMTDTNLSPDAFRSGIQDVVLPFIERKKATLLKQMGVYGQTGMNPAADKPVTATPGAKETRVKMPDGSVHVYDAAGKYLRSEPK